MGAALSFNQENYKLHRDGAFLKKKKILEI